MGTGTAEEQSLLSTTLITPGHSMAQLNPSPSQGQQRKGGTGMALDKRTGAGPRCTGLWLPGGEGLQATELRTPHARCGHSPSTCCL